MPFANIKLIEGIFTDNEKQQMIEGVTDAITNVAGEPLRNKTVVLVEETKSGDWGVGGQTLTSEHVSDVRNSG